MQEALARHVLRISGEVGALVIQTAVSQHLIAGNLRKRERRRLTPVRVVIDPGYVVVRIAEQRNHARRILRRRWR